jgi:hypothetical protein
MFNLNRYWILLCLLLVGYGLFEFYRPKPLDWRDSYSNKDKIPFGGEVIYKLLPEIMGGQQVKSLRVPPYNHLEQDSFSKEKTSYIFINNEFKIDENDQKALLRYVGNGNSVFISAYDFPDSIMKVLGVKAMLHKMTKQDTAKYVNFVNPGLRDKKGYIFPRDDGRNYLKVTNGSKVILLAANEDHEPVFVQVNYGKGQFFLHNLPLAFTNFFVVDSLTNRHAFKALSYLPKQPVFWDEYQKQGRYGENENSVFRYIVSQPALRTAYYLALVGLLLFVVFSGKRTQRVIPVVNPPRNVSLEFVQTIGNMYYKKGDHANMAGKLIQNFWIYVRERFGITAGQFGENEIFSVLAVKSGLEPTDMNALQTEIEDESGKWTGDRILDLNKKLEDFYKRTR